MSSQTMSYAFSEHYTAWCNACKKYVKPKVEIDNGNYPQADIDCEECGTNLLRIVRK